MAAAAAAVHPKLHYYRIVTDVGAAPHISDDFLSLTICKPSIRSRANPGDYVMALIGTSGEIGKSLLKTKKMNKERKQFYMAYLYRVSDKIDMREYSDWCEAHAPSKISCAPNFSGNCQYFGPNLEWRPGPHGKHERPRNISGKFSLVSDHYGAWTSHTPYMLSDEEMIKIGLEPEKVKKQGIGQAQLELRSPGQIEELERLISLAPNKAAAGAAAGAGGAGAGRGGARRRTRRQYRRL